MAANKNWSGWKVWASGTLLFIIALSWAWTGVFGVRDAKTVTAMQVGKSSSTEYFLRLEAVAVAPFVVRVAYDYSAGFCVTEGTAYLVCLPGVACKEL
jgi:hypothetical protein